MGKRTTEGQRGGAGGEGVAIVKDRRVGGARLVARVTGGREASEEFHSTKHV